jgi:hypothetical protein
MKISYSDTEDVAWTSIRGMRSETSAYVSALSIVIEALYCLRMSEVVSDSCFDRVLSTENAFIEYEKQSYIYKPDFHTAACHDRRQVPATRF